MHSVLFAKLQAMSVRVSGSAEHKCTACAASAVSNVRQACYEAYGAWVTA
jgi:hypothetical protein